MLIVILSTTTDTITQKKNDKWIIMVFKKYLFSIQIKGSRGGIEKQKNVKKQISKW